MNTRIIEERLARYGSNSDFESTRAIREITQELILFALSTTDFFTRAAFQGGTCLRIVHGLDRFSEDMDFIAKRGDLDFSWMPYIALVGTVLEQYGYRVELQDKSQADDTVKKAFIKDDSIGKLLSLSFSNRAGVPGKIRIKLEIDTNPPGGGAFETKYIGFPAAASITTETLSTMFAGKSHALLCRKYEKGRDWYDFIWFITRKTEPDYLRLSAALQQSGPWRGQEISADKAWYLGQMKKRIENADWDKARADVAPFISLREQKSLEVWSRFFFLSMLEELP